MLLRQIFDPDFAQYAYLLACQQTKQGLLVDPQRDVDRYLAVADDEDVEIVAVAETHIHADFLSGAREFAERLGIRAYLSAEGGSEWQYSWATSNGLGRETVLLRDGDAFAVGSVGLEVIFTPGHTPEHLTYLVTDRSIDRPTPVGLLSGDFVLVGDLGRPDLLEQAGGGETPEASARALYRSVAVLERLDDHLQLWPAHGAGSSCGKAIGDVPTTTVGYERRHNPTLRQARQGEEGFVRSILADQPIPPTYFGRMKQTNRAGPPLLRRVPRPRRLGPSELEAVSRHGETVVLDAREARREFMARHLPTALHAPHGRSFSSAVGSVLAEHTRPIVLVAEAEAVDRLVRDLVRMGYDQVVAYVTSQELEEYFASGGESASIATIDFREVRRLVESASPVIVDVRDRFEYASGHIPSAVNAPYTRLPDYLESRIPRGEPLVVHCESGMRSAVASALLAGRGWKVLYVDDNWCEWERNGGTVVAGSEQERASP